MNCLPFNGPLQTNFFGDALVVLCGRRVTVSESNCDIVAGVHFFTQAYIFTWILLQG